MVPFNEYRPLSPPPSSPRRQSVLLVDEDAKDLKHFTTLLERMGYSVRAFADYREAEGSLEHGYFDLVIMSQSSPDFDTRRLVAFTLGRDRYTPALVLTRCLKMKSYLEAMQLGVAGYFEKSLSPAELERLVATHCKPRGGEFSDLES
ncbi:MAG TPA: response regulator [Terriglobia bacterium]|nr:response regulator [Terriglobia bacterium]